MISTLCLLLDAYMFGQVNTFTRVVFVFEEVSSVIVIYLILVLVFLFSSFSVPLVFVPFGPCI